MASTKVEMGTMMHCHRAHAAAIAVLLAAMLWAASTARPPLLSVSEVPTAGDGTVIRVVGIVTDICVYDSGYVAIVLADLRTGVTAHVVVPPSRFDGAASTLAIGDQILAEGTTSLSPQGVTIFADAGVDILSRSEFAMSVEYLCSHWQLFEYDRFNVTGTAVFDDGSGGWWLSDTSREHRISIIPCDEPHPLDDGCRFLLDCTLIVDVRTMIICLKAWSATPFEP